MSDLPALDPNKPLGEFFIDYYSAAQDLAQYMVNRHASFEQLVESEDGRTTLWGADLEIAVTQTQGLRGVPGITTSIRVPRPDGPPRNLLSYSKNILNLDISQRADNYKYLGPSSEGHPCEITAHRFNEEKADYSLLRRGLAGEVVGAIGRAGLSKDRRKAEPYGNTHGPFDRVTRTFLPTETKRLQVITKIFDLRLAGINDILAGAEPDEVLALLDSFPREAAI